MGKPPGFLELKVVDTTGAELGPNEVGEIIIRREPTGAAGYWNRPEDEAKKFRGIGYSPATWERGTRTGTSTSSAGRTI